MDGFSSFTEGYEYIAFPDGTKITFSNILTSDNGEKYVRVFVRQWDVEKDRFNTINMNLPSGRIIYKVGFSEDVADDHIRHICTLKNVIWECAEEKTEESVKENKRLMKEYTFLIPRNRENGEILDEADYSCTMLDPMPKGWKKAFGEDICREIKAFLFEENMLEGYWVKQIKEKFGSLRWYDNDCSRHAKLKQIKSKYVELSEHTCVMCGAEGTMRDNLRWISPFCDECYEELIEWNPYMIRKSNV